MPTPSSVVATLELRLVVAAGASLPVAASLRYDIDDPYAVTVAFNTTESRTDDTQIVAWTFARSLLSEGLSVHVGDGDVKVWPVVSAEHSIVSLSLSAPSGTALFELPAEAVADFLTRSFEAVPTGSESEHVDLDRELALLLWAEPGT